MDDAIRLENMAAGDGLRRPAADRKLTA